MKQFFYMAIIILGTLPTASADSDQQSIVSLADKFTNKPRTFFVATECSICTDKIYNFGCFKQLGLQKLTYLQCGHLFHTECAEKHFSTKHSEDQQINCPLCNQWYCRVACGLGSKARIISALKKLRQKESISKTGPAKIVPLRITQKEKHHS
jgi:hypothetical protein